MRNLTIRLKELLTHESSRRHFQFVSVFIIMAVISGFMSVMNYFTGWREALMISTLTFALLNVLNVLLELFGSGKIQRVARVLFAVEIIALFTFFVINGQPEGFSTLWSALLPACGMLLYKGKVGSLISGVQFIILIFLFWVPAGQQFLNYEYNDVFMMRFPVLYAAFFVVGLFFELVLNYTQQELKATRDRYKTKNFRMLQVLADEYVVVMSVNLDSGKMEFYSGQNFIPADYTAAKFNDFITCFSDNLVIEDCRKQFGEFFDKDTILKNLRFETSSILTFAAKINGAERYYQARIVGVPEESGSARHIVVAFSDADAYVREQHHIQQELRAQRTKAENASQAKTDFLFNMSHDIRTPMNAITGFTNMAIREIDNPDKVRECLSKVSLSSEMLLALINDILDMSRIESGKVRINAVPEDIGTIFDNVQSVMANMAATKDIEIHYDISGIRNRFVYMDKPRVDRVLVNLVSNAIKYTEGNGMVQVRCEQIDGDAKPGYGIYRFSVKDNGIGMSETFQKQMFEEFVRAENPTIQGVQGTGLGLPLVKKLSEMMGGSISWESTLGVGSTFFVTLPLKLQENVPSELESVAPRNESEIDVAGRKVLLVEDNELNREIATYILEDKGMVVEVAVDGRDAVRIVSEKGPDHYDFILMDIQMPVMNGYEAAERIRTMFPDSRIPIIALSANAFEEDRQRSLSAGMNDHVSKPIDIQELLKAFSKFL